MSGRLFAVVGPSGAGKDTLMQAVRAARPGVVLARRVITRPTEAGGEDFEGVDEAEFARRMTAGAFVLHWRAHGLRYGVPGAVRADLAAGRDVLFNGSRAGLAEAAAAFPALRVLHITARPEVLAARLAARGRECADQIGARLARADLVLPGLPAGVAVTEIDNSGPLDGAVAMLLAALQPDSGTR
ncbi:ribose 1,5-bisphosphate phosphokinase [Defluviimonas sp. 20V17]|uniref:Ribose 1,5-bisphosphate phosphokinase PhnN n=1 Tax=Allgaiera indica TaxID=765699 RepID=A0AAN4ZZ12_9RHOB|nr:phosphonate metabolism protein/1,5-bisphosphokinase (PRPP-forming) PhnN [Allgaiera indica]KDB02778.1 ribose 1,5-bisphosphate phosphokinase [Defluviimonas sp. 20V17]GHE01198.1 ribose 1,5-bisphosphate phosphokinase PhnN [Allgaiera indica]SDW82505.1 ribose 1,5-bisphosphokinase [Allgaiera indica]